MEKLWRLRKPINSPYCTCNTGTERTPTEWALMGVLNLSCGQKAECAIFNYPDWFEEVEEKEFTETDLIHFGMYISEGVGFSKIKHKLIEFKLNSRYSNTPCTAPPALK